MRSYVRLHVGLFILMALGSSACTSSSPKMTVIGVKAPRIQSFASPSVKVFVEVYNPTRTELSLDHLRYQLVAEDWFDSKGVVTVERVIAAGASAVVEILVPVTKSDKQQSRAGIPYRLSAQLFAKTGQALRSWELRSEGELSNTRHVRLANRYALRSP